MANKGKPAQPPPNFDNFYLEGRRYEVCSRPIETLGYWQEDENLILDRTITVRGVKIVVYRSLVPLDQALDQAERNVQ